MNETRRDDVTLTVRKPALGDAADIHQLVVDGGTLEANSGYAYVLLCSHFAATSLVAEAEGELLGFVTGYRPPSHPDSVFVWQIGIASHARGRGLASILLDRLVALPACADVQYLEATVTPSNEPSKNLFLGFARRHGVPCRVRDGFAATVFPDECHESEQLYQIGPLPD